MENTTDYKVNETEAMPEMLRFEVSKKQLIGEPWKMNNGEMFQKILIGDGWMIVRPLDKLKDLENGRVAFSMAKNKRNGSVNEISLQRSVDTGKVDEGGKKIYQQEKMTVPVAELEDIMKYAAMKYKYQKEQEEGVKKQQEASKEPAKQTDIDLLKKFAEHILKNAGAYEKLLDKNGKLPGNIVKDVERLEMQLEELERQSKEQQLQKEEKEKEPEKQVKPRGKKR